MNKEFIPYEEALALKELGFDEECLGYYHTTLMCNDVNLVIGKTPNRFYHLIRIPENFDTLAPIYQQAFRWFREKFNLIGGIEYIGGETLKTTWWDIYVVGNYNIEYNEMEMKYQPYEEAELELLRKLIEIAKSK